MGRGPGLGVLGQPDIRAEAVFIYALAEPGTLDIRYVGKSSRPARRIPCHVNTSQRMARWLQKLRAAGKKPRLLILARVDPGEDADPYERRLIAACAEAGHDLLNARGVPRRKDA
jgi:hypothetical protein